MTVEMNKPHRDLILASEIAGFLHDLGKLLPDFAEENFKKGNNLSEQAKERNKIGAAHGAILEPGRLYPSQEQLAAHAEWQALFDRLLCDPSWQAVIDIPAAWRHENTRQAQGLGAPLRQHHAVYGFPEDQQTLFGDVYSGGADIRDSALDKGSGKCADAKQAKHSAWICDGLGRKRAPYSVDTLSKNWEQTVAVLQRAFAAFAAKPDVLSFREALYRELKPIFEQALGETRRPTNDVTLYHHCFSSASHFKAAMAEGVLRRDFRAWQNKKGLFNWNELGRIRFRLLGIRWHWAELSRGVLRPVALAGLSQARRQAESALNELLALRYPIGNVIYRDDDGVLLLVPGFYQGTGDAAEQSSEALFAEHVLETLQHDIASCLSPLGCGTGFHLYWSAPTLYLTDYAEALGVNPNPARQRFLQVGLTELQALWHTAPQRFAGRQIQICPQCGLRPAATREMALDESALGEQDLCAVCTDLCNEQAFKERRRSAETLFGVQPRGFNLQDISQRRNKSENGRMVLISVQVDSAAIAGGEALATQLARPLEKIEGFDKLKWNANQLGDAFDDLLKALRNNDAAALDAIDKDFVDKVGDWIGDNFWLSKNKDGQYKADGRSLQKDKFAQALDVAESFYLREAAPKNLGLCRHDGDRLALFAQRKHASPARLQRLWDDLEALWRETIGEIAALTGNDLMPLSLDTRGLRVIVAAGDASDVLLAVQRRLLTHFSKVRGGLPVHVSALAMRAKFPLYIAMDAIYRMERRVAAKPRQEWTVMSCEKRNGFVNIAWQTPQGQVDGAVDLDTGDPAQEDIWHPHLVCTSRAEGPDRLVHVSRLNAGDVVSVPVSTFDFMTLEGSARRFDIHYDDKGRRPHLIFGRPGRAPHLLEQMPEIIDSKSNWAAKTAWNSSQLKGLHGRFVETYENWVHGAVDEAQRELGFNAWRAHVADVLGRYLPGHDRAELRKALLEAVVDGRFFDAVEWNAYICKSSSTRSEPAELSTQD